jgi:hypothetical protein
VLFQKISDKFHRATVDMDYWAAIRDLQKELQRVDGAIANLEATLENNKGESTHRRGRRMMPPEERLKVSARMKRYWSARRELTS